MSSLYAALPVALPPTVALAASPAIANGHNGHSGYRPAMIHRNSRSSLSPTNSVSSIGGGGKNGSPTSPLSPNTSSSSAVSPLHHPSSCMLVNGGQRKLSNSYLRYQRRYSKHG